MFYLNCKGIFEKTQYIGMKVGVIYTETDVFVSKTQGFFTGDMWKLLIH